MPCTTCARNFNFMCREYGCAKCGFAFCSKCLQNKICRNCATKTQTADVPPVIVQQQLERLENPNKPPITVYTESSRLGNLKRGLSTEDQELVDRLQKLKQEVREFKVVPPSQNEIEERFQKLKNEVKELKQIPSQEEIEERLARLRGVDPSVYKKPCVFIQPHSGVDSVTALIGQVSEEVAIDCQSNFSLPTGESGPSLESSVPDDPEELLRREIQAAQQEAHRALQVLKNDKEIKERLKQLKIDDRQAEKDRETSGSEDEEDDERKATAIVEKAVAESHLELMNEDEPATAEDELPWCQLCNEDAQLRCDDCDGELFCRRCFKETHADRRHSTRPFTGR